MKSSEETEIKMLEKAASDFAKNELLPDREENDRYPFFPFFKQVLKKAFELDFFHVIVPEKMGGIGQGVRVLSKLLDHICQVDASLGGIIFTTIMAQEILIQSKSFDILEELVDQGNEVDSFLLAFPTFNNPSEITHAADLTKIGSTYFLSGNLEYVVLGGFSKQAIVPAINENSDLSFVLIKLDDAKVNASKPVFSLGLHACPAVDLKFDQVEAKLIGQEGEGATYFKKSVDRLSVAAAAMSVGLMKGSLKEATIYAKSRLQGGRKIINWSAVKMLLADMLILTETADLALVEACLRVDKRESGWELTSQALAAHIQSNAVKVTTDGIQVLGGYGYMKDYGQEKRFRDAKHLQALLGLAPMKKLNVLNQMIGKK